MRLRSALLVTTALGIAVATSAQADPPITGLYAAAGAGYNFLQDEHLGPEPTGGAADGAVGHHRYRSGDGFDGVASIGYGLGNGLRVEVQGH